MRYSLDILHAPTTSTLPGTRPGLRSVLNMWRVTPSLRFLTHSPFLLFSLPFRLLYDVFALYGLSFPRYVATSGQTCQNMDLVWLF